MTEPIRVGVLGARGRMGQQVCQAVDAAEDLDLVAMVEWRQHQPDWSAVDVATELMSADCHERGASVGARAAADACECVAKDRICAHLLTAVIDDHAVHLFRPVDADGQRLLDVSRA